MKVVSRGVVYHVTDVSRPAQQSGTWFEQPTATFLMLAR
ncbi:hypothetical protein F7D09_1656 [Bifidobacterium leontopitheci]|uniref:Uncharacterized protein n=1 Tax=Bifidobacterium leontopitheci TaxID=2650774 RepID=A0A6I1GE02_9BIFI|nr:hypothetical protein F7D09_1656 [Bifidobacterium leontopitheci]